jgi:tRNA threonylcarbamoyladenosine biosynthesis protein TsaB
MLTLGIDTATEKGAVGLYLKEPLGELLFGVPLRHAERLLLAVDYLLKIGGVKRGDLELISVAAGPGSFTGLRIGMATAKGLALALDIPIVGVPTMDAYAAKVNFWPSVICVLIPDRRDLVYTATFSSKKKIGKEKVQSIKTLKPNNQTLLIGPGAESHRRLLEDKGGIVAPSFLNQPSGVSIAALGVERVKMGLKETKLLYVQRPLVEEREVNLSGKV